jgi:hypothetical protein
MIRRRTRSPAEVNDQVGGEDAEEDLVIHYGPDGLPHAFEIEPPPSGPIWSPAPFPPCAPRRASRCDLRQPSLGCPIVTDRLESARPGATQRFTTGPNSGRKLRLPLA